MPRLHRLQQHPLSIQRGLKSGRVAVARMRWMSTSATLARLAFSNLSAVTAPALKNASLHVNEKTAFDPSNDDLATRRAVELLQVGSM